MKHKQKKMVVEKLMYLD